MKEKGRLIAFTLHNPDDADRWATIYRKEHPDCTVRRFQRCVQADGATQRIIAIIVREKP